jgi:creatinine amidohydrolase
MPEAELRSAVALLPIGAIEQHGPHLPTGVDTYQCVGIVQSALDGLDAGKYDRDGPVAQHIFTLPTQDIGTSHEHLQYVSITQSTHVQSSRALASLMHSVLVCCQCCNWNSRAHSRSQPTPYSE